MNSKNYRYLENSVKVQNKTVRIFLCVLYTLDKHHWTTMISGFVKAEKYEDAIQVF